MGEDQDDVNTVRVDSDCAILHDAPKLRESIDRLSEAIEKLLKVLG